MFDRIRKEVRDMIYKYKDAFSLRDEIGTCPNIEIDCVDLSFCWFIFDTGTFSLSQNMLLIVKDKLSSSLSSSTGLIRDLRSDEELRELESLSLTIKSIFCEREKNSSIK